MLLSKTILAITLGFEFVSSEKLGPVIDEDGGGSVFFSVSITRVAFLPDFKTPAYLGLKPLYLATLQSASQLVECAPCLSLALQ